jgi:ferredoxin
MKRRDFVRALGIAAERPPPAAPLLRRLAPPDQRSGGGWSIPFSTPLLVRVRRAEANGCPSRNETWSHAGAPDLTTVDRRPSHARRGPSHLRSGSACTASSRRAPRLTGHATPDGPDLRACAWCRYCMVSCPFDAEVRVPANPRIGASCAPARGGRWQPHASKPARRGVTFGRREPAGRGAAPIYTEPTATYHIYGEHEAAYELPLPQCGCSISRFPTIAILPSDARQGVSTRSCRWTFSPRCSCWGSPGGRARKRSRRGRTREGT